jgi:hypothetical protein
MLTMLNFGKLFIPEQKPVTVKAIPGIKVKTHVGPPYPDIGILTEDELSKHETKVNLLKSEWKPNAYSQFPFPSEQKSVIVKAISGIKVNIIFLQKNTL